jgi:hypothetical protein
LEPLAEFLAAAMPVHARVFRVRPSATMNGKTSRAPREGIAGTSGRNRRAESVFAKQPKNLPLSAVIGVKPKIYENNFIAKTRDSESAKCVL